MNKINPTLDNFINLELCILNNKTLKAAFKEFAQADYTFEQVRGFYYRYKENLNKIKEDTHKCSKCGKFYYSVEREFVVNKYSHFGLRRVIDAVFTLGFSEKLNYTVSICPFCGEINVIHCEVKW